MAIGALGLIVGDMLWTLDLADGTWSVLSPAYVPYLLWPGLPRRRRLAAAARPPRRGPSAVGRAHRSRTTLIATAASILLLVANEWVDVPAASVVLAALALLTAGHRSGIALAARAAREPRRRAGARARRGRPRGARQPGPRACTTSRWSTPRTGTVKGAEALLRWYRDGAFVPPDSFLGAVERSELMRPLTDFVLDRALETAARVVGRRLPDRHQRQPRDRQPLRGRPARAASCTRSATTGSRRTRSRSRSPRRPRSTTT